MNAPERASAVDVSVSELRAVLAPFADPSFPPGMPPHITLLYPWVPAPVPPDRLATLARVVQRCAPFSVRLGAVRQFPGHLLYLAVEPETEVRALMQRLGEAFPETPLYGGTIDDPVPHVSVRRCADEDECASMTAQIEAALASVRPIDVAVERVTVHERGDDGVWRPRVEVALGAASERRDTPE